MKMNENVPFERKIYQNVLGDEENECQCTSR